MRGRDLKSVKTLSILSNLTRAHTPANTLIQARTQAHMHTISLFPVRIITKPGYLEQHSQCPVTVDQNYFYFRPDAVNELSSIWTC